MSATAQQSDVLTRDEIAVEDTWDLSDLYANDAAWEADVSRLEYQLATAASHRDMLGDSPMALAVALDDAMKARLTLERLITFAALRKDEDQTDGHALGRYERATRLAIQASEQLAFIEPELLGLPETRFATLAVDAAVNRYRHMLDDLQRRRPHVRSIEIEELLAQSGDVARTASEAFGALDNADLSYGSVEDEDGKQITLTKGRYGVLMERKNRDVRRRAHETLTQAYQDHKHTLASLYGASVRKDIYYARAHNHASAREAALFDHNIPTSVYDSLMEAVREARPTLERAMRLRKRLLGVDQLAVYDLRVPLAPSSARSFAYRDATEIVLNGLDRLGSRYVDDLGMGFDSRWVDVHESKGKRSGAYSWGAYGAHPVMLMNWNGSLSDVFTLAHEAGHAMHSYYADKAQPYHDAGYPIFLAEIASTVNEVLLTWRMLEESDPNDHLGRFELLNRFADDVSSTLVNQVMYADFELRAHQLGEDGEPLTLETLSDIWAAAQAQYLPGVEIDDNARIRWARIPHFYRAFYVYQYATGLSAAIAFATRIRDEGEPAQQQFLQLLAAGGSDYPLELLKRAGLDMESPEPVRAALSEYDRVLWEMEAMVDAGQISTPNGSPNGAV